MFCKTCMIEYQFTFHFSVKKSIECAAGDVICLIFNCFSTASYKLIDSRIEA